MEQLSLFPELEREEREGEACEPMLERMERAASKPGAPWPFWLRNKRRRRPPQNAKQAKLPGVKTGPTRVIEALEAIERGMPAPRRR